MRRDRPPVARRTSAAAPPPPAPKLRARKDPRDAPRSHKLRRSTMRPSAAFAFRQRIALFVQALGMPRLCRRSSSPGARSSDDHPPVLPPARDADCRGNGYRRTRRRADRQRPRFATEVRRHREIAQTAWAAGDLRFIWNEQRESAKAKMRAVIERHLPFTSASIEFVDSYPAMSPTRGNYALLSQLDGVSRDLGVGAVPALDPASAAPETYPSSRLSSIRSTAWALAGQGRIRRTRWSISS